MKANQKKVALIFMLASLVLGACTGSKSADTVIKINQPKGEPLAQVGDVTLTLEKLSEDFLDRQGSFAGAEHLNTDEKRKEFVENQVTQETLFQEAVKLGYFNNVEVMRNVKKIVVQQLMRDKLKDVQKDYVPSEEEMLEHYNENLNLYKREEAVGVSVIAVSFGGNKALAKQVAENIRKDAESTIKFANKRAFERMAQVASGQVPEGSKMTISESETGYTERENFDKKFKKGAFEILKNMKKVGDISPVMEGSDAYLVMMKNGFRKHLDESLESAKPKIKKRLAFKNRGKSYDDYVAGLRKKYKVKIYEERIADLGKEAIEMIKANKSVAENN